MKTVFQILGGEAMRAASFVLLGALSFGIAGGATAAEADPSGVAGIGQNPVTAPDRPDAATVSVGVAPLSDAIAGVVGEKAWTAVLDDDFESGFPGSNWSVYVGESAADAYWGAWTCWSSSVSHSVGCAAGGTEAIACDENYPNDMWTRMLAGPFDLSDPNILDAALEFSVDLSCEDSTNGDNYRDRLLVLASIDNANFYGVQYAGQGSGTLSLDLTALPVIGDVTGQSQVWIAFDFESDSSVNLSNGAQIDDVQLIVDLNEAPQVTLTSPVGGEILTPGATETILFSVTDADGGPGDLTIALDYSTNGGSAWTEIASGLPYTGSHDWTVPDVATTQGRVRVRAFDGAAEGSASSPADFTIQANEIPTVSILSPNGGELLEAGASTTIVYTADDADAGPEDLRLTFEYSIDAGANWIVIAADRPDVGSQQWTLPDLTSTRAMVRATASDGSATASDVSDAVFTIAQTISTLDLGDGAGPSGTTVTVDLSLENEIPVGGLQADLVFDGSQTFLSGITTTGRAAAAVAEAEQTGENGARILIYFDTDNEMAAGSGAIARLEFTLQGPGGGATPVNLQDVVLADPDGAVLGVESSGGVLTIGTPEDAPALQISALKNPARPRTLQILVQVDNGSGSAPTVTANNTGLSLTSLGQAVYLATYAAGASTTTVTIHASDSNIQGIGTAQITVELP